MEIILLDTEGLKENPDDYDSQIFLFALLLSSFFLYNTKGNIDDYSIDDLSFVINVSKEIQAKSSPKLAKSSGGQEMMQYYPSFMWLVRDSTLSMKEKSGSYIKPKEYLEKCLEMQKGLTDSVEMRNRIKRLFKVILYT